jgi:hypothetical protein
VARSVERDATAFDHPKVAVRRPTVKSDDGHAGKSFMRHSARPSALIVELQGFDTSITDEEYPSALSIDPIPWFGDTEVTRTSR